MDEIRYRECNIKSTSFSTWNPKIQSYTGWNDKKYEVFIDCAFLIRTVQMRKINGWILNEFTPLSLYMNRLMIVFEFLDLKKHIIWKLDVIEPSNLCIHHFTNWCLERRVIRILPLYIFCHEFWESTTYSSSCWHNTELKKNTKIVIRITELGDHISWNS